MQNGTYKSIIMQQKMSIINSYLLHRQQRDIFPSTHYLLPLDLQDRTFRLSFQSFVVFTCIQEMNENADSVKPCQALSMINLY